MLIYLISEHEVSLCEISGEMAMQISSHSMDQAHSYSWTMTSVSSLESRYVSMILILSRLLEGSLSSRSTIWIMMVVMISSYSQRRENSRSSMGVLSEGNSLRKSSIKRSEYRSHTKVIPMDEYSPLMSSHNWVTYTSRRQVRVSMMALSSPRSIIRDKWMTYLI